MALRAHTESVWCAGLCARFVPHASSPLPGARVASRRCRARLPAEGCVDAEAETAAVHTKMEAPSGGLPQKSSTKPLALNMKAPKKSPFQVCERHSREVGGALLTHCGRLKLFGPSSGRSFTRRRRRPR